MTVGRLRIHSGDLLLADGDGCVRIPTEHVDDVLRLAEEVRTREAGIFDFYESDTFSLEEMRGAAVEMRSCPSPSARETQLATDHYPLTTIH